MTIDLGVELTAQLAESRADAEALMLDTCTVKPVTGEATDETTGVVTPTYGAPIYGPGVAPLPGKRAGMCKVQTVEPQERTPEAGGATYTVQRYRVDVPVGAFVPAVGQVVTMTAAALDPNLAGREFRVVALLHKSMATAYRLGVEDDTIGGS